MMMKNERKEERDERLMEEENKQPLRVSDNTNMARMHVMSRHPLPLFRQRVVPSRLIPRQRQVV
jgi:hypothetical protein